MVTDEKLEYISNPSFWRVSQKRYCYIRFSHGISAMVGIKLNESGETNGTDYTHTTSAIRRGEHNAWLSAGPAAFDFRSMSIL